MSIRSLRARWPPRQSYSALVPCVGCWACCCSAERMKSSAARCPNPSQHPTSASVTFDAVIVDDVSGATRSEGLRPARSRAGVLVCGNFQQTPTDRDLRGGAGQTEVRRCLQAAGVAEAARRVCRRTATRWATARARRIGGNRRSLRVPGRVQLGLHAEVVSSAGTTSGGDRRDGG